MQEYFRIVVGLSASVFRDSEVSESEHDDGLVEAVRNAGLVWHFASTLREPIGGVAGFRRCGSFHRRDQMGAYPPGVAGSRR